MYIKYLLQCRRVCLPDQHFLTKLLLNPLVPAHLFGILAILFVTQVFSTYFYIRPYNEKVTSCVSSKGSRWIFIEPLNFQPVQCYCLLMTLD